MWLISKLSKNIVLIIILLIILLLTIINNSILFEGIDTTLTPANRTKIENKYKNNLLKEGKEKILNINFDKNYNLQPIQQDIDELNNTQLEIDNSLDNINQSLTDIVSKAGKKFGNQILNLPAKNAVGHRVVTDGMKRHLNHMVTPNPFNPSSSSNTPNDLEDLSRIGIKGTACISARKCQTPDFYKGIYIPVSNSLFGECPCPSDPGNNGKGNWACCPTATIN